MENSCRLAIQILFRIFEVGRAVLCKMLCFALLATKWRSEVEVSGQEEEVSIMNHFKIKVQLWLVKH